MALSLRRVIAAFVVFGCSLAAHGASMWFAGEHSLFRVDTQTNQISQSLPFEHTRSIQIDSSSGGIWAASDRYLSRFNAAGLLQFNLDLKQAELEEAERISVNPYDGSLWVALDKAIIQVDQQGNVIGRWATEKIRRIATGLDESVWLLGNKKLSHLGKNGDTLGAWNLHGSIQSEPKYLALDVLGDRIWVAGGKRVTQLDLKNPANVLASVSISESIQDIAIDAHAGTVWVLAGTTLGKYSREGSLLGAVDLKALGIEKPGSIAFDQEAKAAWIGHRKGLTKFSVDLALVASLATETGVAAIAVSAFSVLPTLALIQPPSDALTTNPKPPISLLLGATCLSESCDFLPSYYAHYKLDAFLNGVSIGDAFVYDNLSGQSTYSPQTKLPEGANRFTAKAQDRFGHTSNVIDSIFTVDTTAPKFLSLAPATGTIFNVPVITISGSIDDPQGVVVFEKLEAWNGVGQNPAKQTFSYQITLKPGLNTLTLVASDKAGNITSATLNLTYLPSSLSLEITNPVTGTSVTGDNVNVWGTFQGPANTGITVNGEVANVSGNKFAASNVPLLPGSNTLTITATAGDGQTVTKTVGVTSTGTAAWSVTTEPEAGIAPLSVSFLIDNRSANPPERIEVDFEGDGIVDMTTTDPGAAINHTYALPGIFPARVILTDSQGSHSQTVLISVQDPAQMDQMFKALWDGMNVALIAKNKAKALEYLNDQARIKYEPVFDALMPYFSNIVGSYSALQRVSISGDIGEYAVNRTIRGVNNIFLIYFLKDADGVWRLDAM